MKFVQQLHAINPQWSTEACIGALFINKTDVSLKPATVPVHYELDAAVDTLLNVTTIDGGLDALATQGSKFKEKLSRTDFINQDEPPPEL